MSQKSPPETVCGAAAPHPNIKRKNKNTSQLGARAHPRVNAVYMAKETKKTGRRPQDSESGANTIGPKTAQEKCKWLENEISMYVGFYYWQTVANFEVHENIIGCVHVHGRAKEIDGRYLLYPTRKTATGNGF